jgi:hypothetical protein
VQSEGRTGKKLKKFFKNRKEARYAKYSRVHAIQINIIHIYLFVKITMALLKPLA